jgi:hypothetical protein
MHINDTTTAGTRWIPLELAVQPTETSCGPTCLQAIYRYYGVHIPVHQIIEEIDTVHGGGTLGVILGNHALRHGFKVKIYTYNLRVFDPTWFPGKPQDMAQKLKASLPHRHKPKLRQAIKAYIEFCEMGGEIKMEVLNGSLIRRALRNHHPIITGLSSTFLYGDMRSDLLTNKDDDLGGDAEGHFVVLTGYNLKERIVHLSDPYASNPIADSQWYSVSMDRLINAILLGVLTYDANLLIIQPRT